jgi:plasmid stabilization system protein ParE
MANKPTEFLEAAASEYEAALNWYFERSQVAAEKFDAEINRALENIAEIPKDGLRIRWVLAGFSCATSPSPSSIGNSHESFK